MRVRMSVGLYVYMTTMYVYLCVCTCACNDALLICMNCTLHESVHYSCTFTYTNILLGKRQRLGERAREQKNE